MDYCYIKKDGRLWWICLKYPLMQLCGSLLEKDCKLVGCESYYSARAQFIQVNRSFALGGYKKIEELPKITIPLSFYDTSI